MLNPFFQNQMGRSHRHPDRLGLGIGLQKKGVKTLQGRSRLNHLEDRLPSWDKPKTEGDNKKKTEKRAKRNKHMGMKM